MDSDQQMRISVLIIFLLISIDGVEAQRNFRIMFYNVENVFDTKDNPLTNDDDFLPQGKLRWSNYRYWKKLNDISKVINSVGENYPPALIGLCEIENDSVLFDLTKRSSLNKHRYSYIITNSRDDRGMNVGLLYQRDDIKILGKKEYTPVFNENPDKHTRNILHVVGKVINGDTLDIFVCHFQSRVEGIKRTRPYRIQTAALLKQKVDSLSHIRRVANIIIMGDFNDYPNDISLHETLGAQSVHNDISSQSLYNMFYHKLEDKSLGTYKYRGKWNYLDQFIVNGQLLNEKSRASVKGKEAQIYADEFLLADDLKYGGKKPYRTYLGWKYLGGFSDHLPIYMDLELR